MAPMTTTPSLLPKPSISTSSWLRVCSRSSWLSDPPRALAMASISSMKMTARPAARALANSSRTRPGADADVLLDELGAGDREERHAGLGGDGLGQHGLAGAGRAVEHHAADGRGAEPDEAARVAQELDGLGELQLRLVRAGDVGERDARAFSRRWPGRSGDGRGRSATGASRGRPHRAAG